jgi:hypothetical protein
MNKYKKRVKIIDVDDNVSAKPDVWNKLIAGERE